MNTVWIVILSVLSLITLITILVRIGKPKRDELKRQKHLDRISKWKVGDFIKPKSYGNVMRSIMVRDITVAKDRGKTNRTIRKDHVELVSWSEDELVYKTESGDTYYGEYSDIEINTSSDRRQRENKMENFMESINDIQKFREERLSKLLDKDK